MAKADGPTEADKRIAELEAKIARAEEDAYLRAKYGAVTEEHLEFYRGVEAAEVAQKAARAEHERRRYAEEKARKATMRKLAGELAISGRLRFYVNGKPERLGAGLLVPCPVCGADAPNFTNRIWEFVENVIGAGHQHPRLMEPAFWDEQLAKLYIAPRIRPIMDAAHDCEKCGARTRLTVLLVPDADATIWPGD